MVFWVERLVDVECELFGVDVVEAEDEEFTAGGEGAEAEFEQAVCADLVPWLEAEGAEFEAVVWWAFEKGSGGDELEGVE